MKKGISVLFALALLLLTACAPQIQFFDVETAPDDFMSLELLNSPDVIEKLETQADAEQMEAYIYDIIQFYYPDCLNKHQVIKVYCTNDLLYISAKGKLFHSSFEMIINPYSGELFYCQHGKF
ncbi:MAG: hypothetical protein Q4C01_05185 [Clostridia bacterium]|nr:hypothetical protein [Clostridia bacterium]